jgi:hypothetical protein
MFKNNLRVLFTFLSAVLLFGSAAAAQTGEEYEAAASSSLTSAKLPAGALRVLPGSVPAEINQGLEKIVEAGEGKLVQGDSEVLAFAGNGYTKAKAAGLMKQIENNLSAAGWKYEVGGAEGGVTFFTVLRENPTRRAVVGYFVPDADALVLAWTEVLSRDSNSGSNSSFDNRTRVETEEPVQTTNVKAGGNLRDLAGKWEKKQSGMSSYQNGMYKGSSGNYESYTFFADGRVEYTSLIAVQNYGCRLEAFSQSKGRASIDGSNLTVSLGAGTIRRDDSCSPSKNYTKPTSATNFTYRWSIEKDEYGTVQLCLTESNGSKYYYRRAE